MNIEFVNILDVDEDLIEQIRIWRNSKQVNQYMYTNHTITREEHKRWIKKLKTSNKGKGWIIKYNDKPVGFAQLSNIDFNNKTTEWGFYIADKSIRGKGVGTASLNKIIEYVFREMKFEKMRTVVLENNLNAIELYKKFGFKKEGKFEDRLKRNGKQIYVILMVLKKDEWKKIKKWSIFVE